MLLQAQDMTPLTEENFQSQVIQAKTLVLVDCWASWCGSSHRINPVYNQVAIAWAGHIKIGRFNIATGETLANHFGIRVVPTLLLFKDGQVIERVVGSLSQQDLTSKLNRLFPAVAANRSPIVCL
jgi:thioredoxin 1